MSFEVLKNNWDITRALISQKPIVYCTGKSNFPYVLQTSCVGYNPGKPIGRAVFAWITHENEVPPRSQPTESIITKYTNMQWSPKHITPIFFSSKWSCANLYFARSRRKPTELKPCTSFKLSTLCLLKKKSLIHGENSVLLKIYAKVNQLSKKTLSTILYHA